MNFRAIAFAAAALVAGPAFADANLAKEKICLQCHAVDKKLVGPAFKDVRAKYEKDKDAVTNLAKKIINGSTGVWGPVPMPPNANVNAEEAKKLAAYVMSIS